MSYNTIVSGKVCFKTDGDVFYYADTHGNDGMYGGMYYYATDGLSHDHDYEFLYDTNGPLNGWEPLNTNEVEGTWVYYRACLQHTNGIFEKCGGYVQSLA